jgi:anti-sigma regulatory factor (Ser/Thr protein kinase)
VNSSSHLVISEPLAYALDMGAPKRGRDEFLRRNRLQPVSSPEATQQPLLLLAPELAAESVEYSLPDMAKAFVELAQAGDVFDLSINVFSRLGENSFFFSFGTPSAYSAPVASFICRQIANRVVWCEDMLLFRMETALHEAVANAAVHGNLNIAGEEYDGENILEDRPSLIAKALEDRDRASRRVSVFALWDESEISVSVSDQGKGVERGEFSPPQWNEAPLCGMGLNLIAKATNSLSWEDGGRTMVMRFSR